MAKEELQLGVFDVPDGVFTEELKGTVMDMERQKQISWLAKGGIILLLLFIIASCLFYYRHRMEKKSISKILSDYQDVRTMFSNIRATVAGAVPHSALMTDYSENQIKFFSRKDRGDVYRARLALAQSRIKIGNQLMKDSLFVQSTEEMMIDEILQQLTTIEGDEVSATTTCIQAKKLLSQFSG